MAAFVWIASAYPKKDVLPLQKYYPKANSHPTLSLTVSGSMPDSLDIELFAFYSASGAALRKKGGDSCYRSIPLGPSIPLHLSESLKPLRRGSHYDVSVFLDKYEAGVCGWHLAAVSYRVLNSLDDSRRASELGWYGTAVAYWVDNSENAARDAERKKWRGRVDIWCLSETADQNSKKSESCGVIQGFSRDYTGLVDAEEGASNASVAIFPDTRAVEINFHDLDALIERGISK